MTIQVFTLLNIALVMAFAVLIILLLAFVNRREEKNDKEKKR